MFAILHMLRMFIADLFKTRWRLEADLLLRHQLSIAFALFNGNHHIICDAGFITIMCAFEFSAHTTGGAVRTMALSRAHKRLAELVGRGERLKGGGTASYLNWLCKKAWCDAMVISFGHGHEHRSQVRLRWAAMVHRARVL